MIVKATIDRLRTLDTYEAADWAGAFAGTGYATQKGRLLAEILHDAVITYNKRGQTFALAPPDCPAARYLLAEGYLHQDTFDARPVVYPTDKVEDLLQCLSPS